jgi:2,5-dihydroxypyridine 5,6-dioxygenase
MTKSLRELFVEQFRLCKLTPQETVAIISDHGNKLEYVAAAVEAAHSLGAGVLALSATSLSHPNLPPYERGSSGREVGALLAAAAECDFVVDVTVAGLIHSDVRTRITGRGKRMLFVAEQPDVLQRLMGTAELRKTAERGRDLLRAGTEMRVTSEAGTDLTVDISGDALPITMQWGYVEEPGRWDHWPSGFIACFPNDRTARGRIVLQPGDVLLPWNRYVRDDVVIKVEAGFITGITGRGADAFVLRDYFESWDDPNVWATSHVGWGFHPQASWSAIDVYGPQTLFGQELRSTSGNFMWSTGSNRFANRDTPAHLDIPMHSCSVAIDGKFMVEAGRLVTA